MHDGKKYALKLIDKEKAQTANINREIVAGKRLNHANLAKFIDFIADVRYDCLISSLFTSSTACLHWQIFEFAEGLDLFTYLESRDLAPISELKVRIIMSQLIDVVQYCHSEGVIHLDIKLDNIIYSPTTERIKLIDFGLCDFYKNGSDQVNRRCGSVEYCAAEVLMNVFNGYSGQKADVWSIGTVLFTLVTARFPFDPTKRQVALARGEPHPELCFPADVELSILLMDLICQMLTVDPADRIPLSDIRDHAWFSCTGECI